MPQDRVQGRTTATGNSRRIDEPVWVSGDCVGPVVAVAHPQSPRTGYPGRTSHPTAPIEDRQGQIRAILSSPEFGPILAGGRSLRRFYWPYVGWTARLADFVEGLDTIAGLGLGR